MDDLSSLDWSTKPEGAQKTDLYRIPSPALAALRPTSPISGRSSPLPKLLSDPQSKTQTPANDSFSNLISFSSASTNKTLSLQEQQRKLLEQKAQQQAFEQKRLQSQYIGGNEQFWNSLGSGRSTPALPVQPSAISGRQFASNTVESNQNLTTNGGTSQPIIEDEDDILAAFKADAPVDSSSHFPKPLEHSARPSNVGQRNSSSVLISGDTYKGPTLHDFGALNDDDPFGLAELPKINSGKPQEPRFQSSDHNEDDDVLGLLGKPVSELRQPQQLANSIPVPAREKVVHPQSQAIAELVEMGFAADKAREALESTGSGLDMQQAVSWLLNKAHSESSRKTGIRRNSNGGPRQSRDPRIDRKTGSKLNVRQREQPELPWSNDQRSERAARHRSPASSNQAERDPAQVASELGTTFLKTAGSLWKSSTKKVQKAVQELNSDSDSSQPRWMKETGTAEGGEGFDHDNVERDATRPRRRSSLNKKLESVTDEAMMLESDRARPPPRKPPRRQEPSLDSSADNSRDHSPAMPSRLRQEFPAQPAFLREQQAKAPLRLEPKAVLNRQTIDDQASQAYVSYARRRKPATKPPVSASEPDLLESASRPQPPSTSRPALAQPFRSSQPSRPVVVRPVAPVRSIPQISSSSLKASHAERESGNDHFKRGDYPAAYQCYTASLRHLPANHPITIILYTNRALTALKIGEPKTALLDTETAITVIGSSRGEAETINLNNGEPPKPMRDYFRKALMRKAEALEQMEKWKEAAVAWKEAVEGGYGGATSIQGRLRCEKIAAPQQHKPAKPPPNKSHTTPAPVRSTIADLNGTADRKPSAAAVNRLRAANAAAEQVDDEKFALADTVDAKLVAWKGGKADNLRALLGSLDAVLWPEAGWKKIGMAELVLPAKVKVQYMKGIAKVHPDKIPTTATTEQRMIAGAVFSTLNEAWDKFKNENGL